MGKKLERNREEGATMSGPARCQVVCGCKDLAPTRNRNPVVIPLAIFKVLEDSMLVMPPRFRSIFITMQLRGTGPNPVGYTHTVMFCMRIVMTNQFQPLTAVKVNINLENQAKRLALMLKAIIEDIGILHLNVVASLSTNHDIFRKAIGYISKIENFDNYSGMIMYNVGFYEILHLYDYYQLRKHFQAIFHENEMVTYLNPAPDGSLQMYTTVFKDVSSRIVGKIKPSDFKFPYDKSQREVDMNKVKLDTSSSVDNDVTRLISLTESPWVKMLGKDQDMTVKDLENIYESFHDFRIFLATVRYGRSSQKKKRKHRKPPQQNRMSFEEFFKKYAFHIYTLPQVIADQSTGTLSSTDEIEPTDDDDDTLKIAKNVLRKILNSMLQDCMKVLKNEVDDGKSCVYTKHYKEFKSIMMEVAKGVQRFKEEALENPEVGKTMIVCKQLENLLELNVEDEKCEADCNVCKLLKTRTNQLVVDLKKPLQESIDLVSLDYSYYRYMMMKGEMKNVQLILGWKPEYEKLIQQMPDDLTFHNNSNDWLCTIKGYLKLSEMLTKRLAKTFPMNLFALDHIDYLIECYHVDFQRVPKTYELLSVPETLLMFHEQTIYDLRID